VADRGTPETWTPLRDSSIHLPDGRLLAFAEWGDPKGRPVFLFHGMPGSRLFFPDPVVAAEARVRAITVDRPGMGRSDPQPDTGSPTGRAMSSRSPSSSAWIGSA